MVLVPIAIIAVVAIFVVPALTKGAPVLSKAGDISAFYSYGKVYVVNNDGSVNELDGVLQGQFKKSLDNTKAAFVVSDDGYSAGTLYYASGKGKPEKIADDVVNFVLADSGDGVAFYNNFDPNARLADLSLYDARNGETHKLDNNAYFTDSYDYYYVAAGFFAVISPDGKTVAYKADYSDGGYKTKININGKAEDLGVNIQPVAVADGAKYIYHIKTRENGEALYVSKGPAAEEIRLDRVSAYNDFHLNADYSQIVFTNYDGKSYVSANGGEKSLIAQYSVDKFLVSADIGYVRKKPEDYYNSMSISVYGLGDFRNRAFSSGGEINYIDGAFERTSVAKSVYGGAEPTITKDGKWVYYVSYGYELKKVSVTDPETAVTVAKEVYGFAVAKDGNTVYYVNYDGDLYSKKSGDDGKGTRISGDVSGYSLCVSGSGTVFFLADFWGSSGTLYTVSGTERKRVRDDVADGVVAGVSAVFYFVYEDRAYDVYRSGGGADFKKVAAADSPLVR
ncbi:MAG: hypothetical protein LBI38_06165 [Oscillospiraceae bacterium]|nr:hypothetical protein [Oscillospiraceae bacterium]